MDNRLSKAIKVGMKLRNQDEEKRQNKINSDMVKVRKWVDKYLFERIAEQVRFGKRHLYINFSNLQYGALSFANVEAESIINVLSEIDGIEISTKPLDYEHGIIIAWNYNIK